MLVVDDWRALSAPLLLDALFALVSATFSLRGSARNPTSPRALHRTALITTTSASEPWKESTVCTAGGGKRDESR